MSAGHKHKSPNLLVPGEAALATLHRLLTTGMAPQMMKRWQHVDVDSDIVYLAGYNVLGTVRMADRDFVHALYEPDYAKQIIGAPIDTGLSPDDTLECLLEHEAVEKVIMDDPTNPIDLYDHHDEPGGFGSHEYATLAEHELVKKKGGTPVKYERGLAKIIKFCEGKKLERVPKDYACAPLLDDPDENEKRIIKRLRALGVVDAFKTSKQNLSYRPSTGADHCSACAHWQNQGNDGLSTCAIADGLVGPQRVCKKFEEKSNG